MLVFCTYNNLNTNTKGRAKLEAKNYVNEYREKSIHAVEFIVF